MSKLKKRKRFRILQRDGFRCQYCGAGAAGIELVIDHVIPLSKGGTNDTVNLVTACQPCNAGKSDHPLTDAAVKALREEQDLRKRAESAVATEMFIAALENPGMSSAELQLETKRRLAARFSA